MGEYKDIVPHSKKVAEVLKLLKTKESGLSMAEAEKRLKKYGPNRLPSEKRLSALQIFFSQLKSPLIYILLIASGLSLLLREYVDMSVILAAVVLNTIIGFLQEYKAEKAITHLKNMVEFKARVMRGGQEMEIKADELTPGDIIFIQAGDKIQADARLLKVNNFQVNEASLTGESLPITKHTKPLEAGTVLADRKNMVFMGTVATRGKAAAVVCATGSNTHLGEIASMVKAVEEDKTPLQHKLAVFSKWLSVIVALISVLIVVEGLIKKRDLFEIIITAVAVAVAAIPEGLIIAVTVILVIGMQKILKRKSLVRRLVAAETLGSTSVICTDKTGTLTEGIMQVANIVTCKKDMAMHGKCALKLKENESRLTALRIGLLNNNAVIENPQDELADWVILGDGTERALLMAAVHAGMDKKKTEELMPRLHEIPFVEEYKYMATLHKNGKGNVIYLKGAPEKIMEMCSYYDMDGCAAKADKSAMSKIKKEYEKLTEKGLRVLALAYKNVSANKKSITDEDLKKMVFVGFMGLKDPLRKEAKETIAKCMSAGIRPVMVTGDHKLTAKAIYGELGLKVSDENILEGRELDKMSDAELEKIIKKIDIFARVEPKHKLRIVDAWQAKGEVVGMTGDGVNDAPALKSADIGIALGSGTDVAKETASLILMDDNFSTIVAAVEQGRVIFDNIRKVVLYLLSDSFSEVIIVMTSLFLGFPLPVTAAQILWVNLVEDGLPNFALAFEPGEPEVMDDPPRAKGEPLLDKEMKFLIFIIGIVTDFILVVLFIWLWKTTGNIVYTRTMVFAGLAMDSLFFIFSCRSLNRTIWHKNPFSNRFLILSTVVGLLMLNLAIYVPFFQKILATVPLGAHDWAILCLIGILNIAMIEVSKWFFIVEKKHHKLLKK